MHVKEKEKGDKIGTKKAGHPLSYLPIRGISQTGLVLF